MLQYLKIKIEISRRKRCRIKDEENEELASTRRSFSNKRSRVRVEERQARINSIQRSGTGTVLESADPVEPFREDLHGRAGKNYSHCKWLKAEDEADCIGDVRDGRNACRTPASTLSIK